MSTSALSYAGWMENGTTVVREDPAASQAAIAALVHQYAGTMYRVAFSVLRNSADAEDAVQEAYLRVLRHSSQLAELRDARVWLIRIVWNVVLDRKRRTKTRPETDDLAEMERVLPAGGLTADEHVAAGQHRATVLRAVDQLPAKERDELRGMILNFAGYRFNSARIMAIEGPLSAEIKCPDLEINVLVSMELMN